MCVAIMRAQAGRDPHDRGLQNLVGELSTRSETFRTPGGTLAANGAAPGCRPYPVTQTARFGRRR
ncbi:MAG TPA: hypothetical protein VH373_21860 [Jatrophihabitantaceae bacterium]